MSHLVRGSLICDAPLRWLVERDSSKHPYKRSACALPQVPQQVTMKPSTLITIGLYVLVALAHILRIIFDWEVIINGTIVPMWVSVVIPIGLAILVCLEFRE
jgi:hypothetical protein